LSAFSSEESPQWERGGASERAEAPAGKTRECEDDTGTTHSVKKGKIACFIILEKESCHTKLTVLSKSSMLPNI